ncbi:MAG: tyrosine--tRNA ligase [Flavobacteriaceae bacterium]|nr:tyrosine--tRNA ligase [Flavobacteriaceae bacterium]
MNLVKELEWRGMVHDIMPGTEEQLQKEMTSAYIGFDPTSDSLHIGSLVPIILLCHIEKAGHQPIALIGGATGMIGDPSGKSNERNLLNEEILAKNVAGIKKTLQRFINFDNGKENSPILVNNYDWMKDFSFIEFARDVGKCITVNYMMAKDSVKKRILGEDGNAGMSFTEFTYQLIQGYDFYYLHKNYNCLLQMGGSDQWGNITTGTELVRRMNVDNEEVGKAYAMTCPLITKADGSKFGKSEGGNIWLDADKTSVYKFYQFWLNTSDEDAEKYIKIFTFLDKETIDSLTEEHQQAPHLRVLQKRLAEEVTTFVHSKEELEKAVKASEILFGKSTASDLKSLDERTFLDVFEGVPQAEITKEDLKELDMIGALSAKTGFLKSNGEARRALKENSISLNKEKVSEDYTLTEEDLIAQKYILLQRGKKNYFLLKIAE